jgi:rod shape-determining protein MreC
VRVKRSLEFHLLALVLLNLALLTFQSQADLWVRGFSAVLGPPVILVHRVLDRVAGGWERLDSLGRAQGENRTLRDRLFWARLENDRLRLENLYLQGFRRLAENPSLEAAGGRTVAVVRRRSASYSAELLVDAGAGRGVKAGQVALAPEGVVGLVVAVDALSATVRPVVHPDSVVSVVDLRSGTHAVAKGDGTGFLELKYLPPYADVAPGDLFVTDCWDFQYHPGLPLGTAVEVGSDESQLRVRLRPQADLASLHWLTLVREAS